MKPQADQLALHQIYDSLVATQSDPASEAICGAWGGETGSVDGPAHRIQEPGSHAASSWCQSA